MCGIAGIFDPQRSTAPEALHHAVRSMSTALRHRGPDDSGDWVDASSGIALGHRRLSIIDLTTAGAQPMRSPSGRYMVSYNGEIYNYRQLRARLEQRGIAFAGSSDTEVLAAGLDLWGVQGSLPRLDGMYAFAVWDSQRNELTLVRDRFGEKPLYWGSVDQRLLFASELRAITAVAPGLDIDEQAVADVLAFKCVRAPRSIYRQIHKLLPGHYLTVNADGREALHGYWSATEVALEARRRPLELSEHEATEALTEHLDRTISSRIVSDVPLGAFLSGGIDSAGIVAFMMRAATGPVRTFSVGLDDPRFDESEQAAAVAKHLGAEHHALRVTPAEVLNLVPKVSEAYDEPFADSSQLPTLLVSAFAAKRVKVALTGDGGDEVFGGYNRHVYGDRLTSIHSMLPPRLRHSVGRRLQGLDPRSFERRFNQIAPLLPPRMRVRLPADKAHKLGRLLTARDRRDIYRALVTDPAAGALTDLDRASASASAHRFWSTGTDLKLSESAMLADTHGYLPDDILVKVDRAAMSVSLETRAPYLDHHLYEWAWRLPSDLRAGSGIGKRVLRNVVGEQLRGLDLSQVKSGFGVPVGEWLRGPLRPWAEDLMSENDGYVDRSALRVLWRDHLAGRRDHTHELWSVLQFRSWLATRRRTQAKAAS